MFKNESTREMRASEKRKEYSPPTLTDYGSISKNTKGGIFVGNEGNTMCNGNSNPTMSCQLS